MKSVMVSCRCFAKRRMRSGHCLVFSGMVSCHSLVTGTTREAVDMHCNPCVSLGSLSLETCVNSCARWLSVTAGYGEESNPSTPVYSNRLRACT